MSRVFAYVVIVCVLAMPAAAGAHYEGELLPDSVAVMEYSMIISMDPSDNLTRNKLGMVYIRQGRLDKAREQFGAILEAEPEDFDALDSMGIISEREGDYAGAAGWYERALDVRGDDAGVRGRLDSAKQKLGGN